MARKPRFIDQSKKELVKIFDEACARHNRWTVWSDFMALIAISISNTVDSVHAEEREKTYLQIAGKYNRHEIECCSRMFAEIVLGMEANPDQDFLGDLFMTLELSNSHAGQFFTPYCVCQAMAKMTEPDIPGRIEREHWISVSDPACGAGALLVAFANECMAQKVNYQTSVLFVAQDIDFVVGCMCYIQLSLLGCAGYVVIDNSITHPSTSYDPRGLIPRDNGQIWYTPFYFREEWHFRRQFFLISNIMPAAQAEQPATEPDPPAPELVERKSGQLSFF